MYTPLEYVVHILFHADKLCEYYNITERLQKRGTHAQQSIPGRFSPPTWPGYEATWLNAQSVMHIDITWH